MHQRFLGGGKLPRKSTLVLIGRKGSKGCCSTGIWSDGDMFTLQTIAKLRYFSPEVTIFETMSPQLPYWSPDADYSRTSFFIRSMDSSGTTRLQDVLRASLPLIGFMFLTGGESLVEIGGEPFLCQSGQLLLIPEHVPFAILYFKDCSGWSGGFSTSALTDGRSLSSFREPLHRAFWFDEASFVSELFNMLEISFENGNKQFLGKGLDILLSMVGDKSPRQTDKRVSFFLDSLFNTGNPIKTGSEYASDIPISLGHLNRLVRDETGRSVGKWIDIARTGRAKRLLRETGMPIIDIASAIGLEDQSYFSRLFKRICGMTPSEFRNNQA